MRLFRRNRSDSPAGGTTTSSSNSRKEPLLIADSSSTSSLQAMDRVALGEATIAAAIGSAASASADDQRRRGSGDLERVSPALSVPADGCMDPPLPLQKPRSSPEFRTQPETQTQQEEQQQQQQNPPAVTQSLSARNTPEPIVEERQTEGDGELVEHTLSHLVEPDSCARRHSSASAGIDGSASHGAITHTVVPPSALQHTGRPFADNTAASTDYQAMEVEDGKQTEIPSSLSGQLATILNWLGGSKSFSPRNSNAQRKDSLMKDDSTAFAPPAKGVGAFLAVFCTPLVLYAFMFFSMAAGLLYGAVKQYDLVNNIDWDEQLWVAFAGSSYLFVNDIPRLMEVISDGQVVQDSCLHAGGSLAALVMTGNGMYYRWRTSEALIQVNDDYAKIYDYGACSVHMLIAGYDKYIEYGNENKAYYNDGSNPCLVDQYYIQYVTSKYSNYPPKWDYVVLADQSKRIASEDARNDTIDALVSVYGPLLTKAGATPLIVDTHAFWSSSANMTGFTDVPTFTQLIYEGVEAYADALASVIPEEQAPVIVPIGLAYLTVWEENYTAWQTLFLSDEVHASFHGSYFFAVVLYTTLFGHLPQKQIAIPEKFEYLFGYSRKNLGGATYPTEDEAQFLNNVAKRVVLHGHVPSSFTGSRRDLRRLRLRR